MTRVNSFSIQSSLIALIYMFAISSLTPAVMAQTYSKTFNLKGQDGGKFRVKAYLRHSQGAKKNRIKVSSNKQSRKVASTKKQPDNKTSQ